MRRLVEPINVLARSMGMGRAPVMPILGFSKGATSLFRAPFSGIVSALSKTRISPEASERKRLMAEALPSL